MVGAEADVCGSGLQWTNLRPPRLTDKPGTGHYRTATLDRNLRGFSISRADLAACALAIVNDATTVHRHAFIATGAAASSEAACRASLRQDAE
jgi:putative NAD(P)-binding protein